MDEELKRLLDTADNLRKQLSEMRPLPSDAMQRIEEAWAVEYTYESNRIEGNTLTLQETSLVINEGITVAGKSMREHLEAINHQEAIALIREIATSQCPIDEYTIREIHALILRGINRENAGKYRSVPVLISGSRHTPPQPWQLDLLMQDFMAEFHRREAAAEHPILLAAYLHDELVRIHPFIDGNGRTSRLLMNLYLLRHGYALVTLKGDNDAKLKYYTALERSHVEGDAYAFCKLVAASECEAITRYLDLLRQ